MVFILKSGGGVGGAISTLEHLFGSQHRPDVRLEQVFPFSQTAGWKVKGSLTYLIHPEPIRSAKPLVCALQNRPARAVLGLDFSCNVTN